MASANALCPLMLVSARLAPLNRSSLTTWGWLHMAANIRGVQLKQHQSWVKSKTQNSLDVTTLLPPYKVPFKIELYEKLLKSGILKIKGWHVILAFFSPYSSFTAIIILAFEHCQKDNISIHYIYAYSCVLCISTSKCMLAHAYECHHPANSIISVSYT